MRFAGAPMVTSQIVTVSPGIAAVGPRFIVTFCRAIMALFTVIVVSPVVIASVSPKVALGLDDFSSKPGKQLVYQFEDTDDWAGNAVFRPWLSGCHSFLSCGRL